MLDNGWQLPKKRPPFLSAGNVGAFPVFIYSIPGVLFSCSLSLAFG